MLSLVRTALFLSSSAFLLASARNLTSKRGLAFSDEDTPGDLNNANQTKSQISWQYDWGNSPPAYIAVSNIQYIPMQWGSGNIELFADAVEAQGAKTVLPRLILEKTFNEPDFNQESNIAPGDAAKLWMQYIEPLKAQGIRLGGPAVTGSPTGLPWYGDGTEGFYGYLWQVHTQFPNLPIWVTEYASTSTNETEVANFLNATIIYMDTLDWIERYAWFGFFRPRANAYYNLLGDDGSLNTLGQIYVGAKTVHTQIVTQPPTKSYQTVNGADSPTQGLVTTYPAAAHSGAVDPFVDLNTLGRLLLALVASMLGATWTIW
ncbi:hypothetical protein H0H81_005935 [Sphagnurus paluster]|uniref:Asl1-like glycosyl hydrolase catalytic domain-containing protein n=1 Tax=Sphagnurus paluster TaxID=117069 RepID=A0A9P7KKZ9_9AGAR|nr:hypothetical protein H0H81_005935 [Sphagnurus paluster]